MRKIPILILFLVLMMSQAFATPVTILALGDSLTAGYGLPPGQGFTDQLQAALKARGHDVTIINGGISGDTAEQGAQRLDWALTPEVKGVFVELGANDALRGLDPDQTEVALRQIMDALKARHLPVLLLGMKAPPNLGFDYGKKFDGIYERLSSDYAAALYPFFLDGVAALSPLNQPDGMHPNEKGVAVIVKKLVPVVESFLAKLS